MENFEKLNWKEKDILRIHKITNKNYKYVTIDEAEQIWESYSALFCAQWETLPSTNVELWNILKRFLEGKKIR